VNDRLQSHYGEDTSNKNVPKMARRITQQKIKISKLSEFDPTKYLDDDEAVANYISLAIEDGDPGLLAAALGDVARARGMTQVALDAGLTREALYKALRADAHPRFDTIYKVCKALGVRLTATAS
jgi:probable addiction module antidote protein